MPAFQPEHTATPHSALSPDDPPSAMIVMEEAEAGIDAEGVIRSGKLAGRTMWSAIWILALPVLFQQTMAAMLGLSDKVFAGALPKEIVVAALDGIGIGSYIGWFIGIAMYGLGVGGQAIIARGMGSGRIFESEHALGQSVSLSMAWGCLVGVALWYCAPPLAGITGLTGDAAVFCIQYVRVLAVSMPFCGLMMVGSLCLHGAGETVAPSVISVLINVVNIAMSWVLSGADVTLFGREFVNPFSFDLGVRGIAAGTAMSYLVGAMLTLAVMMRGVKDLKLRAVHLPIDWAMVKRIMRIGVPNFAEGMSMWAVNIFVLHFIGRIAGSATETATKGLQGAHVIAVQWESFSFLPGFAIGTAAGALAGQYLGAGNARMARKSVLACTMIAAIAMGLIGVVFMTLGEPLVRIVSTEAVHLRHVPNLLFICGTMQVCFAITMVIRQGLRGVGDTTWTFLITTASSYGVRLPAAYFFGVYLGYGIEGIWIGLCGELCVRAVLFSARFAHGGWTRIKV